MNNSFLEMQIQNMLMSLQMFESACELAAKKDDGMIDKAEKRQLDKITAATDRYRKDLQRIMEK